MGYSKKFPPLSYCFYIEEKFENNLNIVSNFGYEHCTNHCRSTNYKNFERKLTWATFLSASQLARIWIGFVISTTNWVVFWCADAFLALLCVLFASSLITYLHICNTHKPFMLLMYIGEKIHKNPIWCDPISQNLLSDTYTIDLFH